MKKDEQATRREQPGQKCETMIQKIGEAEQLYLRTLLEFSTVKDYVRRLRGEVLACANGYGEFRKNRNSVFPKEPNFSFIECEPGQLQKLQSLNGRLLCFRGPKVQTTSHLFLLKHKVFAFYL